MVDGVPVHDISFSLCLTLLITVAADLLILRVDTYWPYRTDHSTVIDTEGCSFLAAWSPESPVIVAFTASKILSLLAAVSISSISPSMLLPS